MKLANLKIGVRLALLGGFFLLAVLIVGYQGWSALGFIRERNAEGLQRSVALTEAVDTARSAQVEFKIQVQEWKNILLRGHAPADLERYTQAFIKSGEQTRASLQKLSTQLDALKLQTPMVAEAIRVHEELGRNYLSALKQYDSAKVESPRIVDALVKGMDRPPTKQIDDIVAYIGEQARLSAAKVSEESAAANRSAVLSLLVLIALTVLLGGAIVWWMVLGITRPLTQAISIAKTVASGDLRAEVEVRSKDEVGELLAALRTMNENLSNIVGRVRGGTDAIAIASTEIAAGNLDLSSRTEEQAGALEETASSMIELTSAVKQNNENAHQARSLASAASDVAARGGGTVSEVVKTMGAINESSRRIVDIISVIDGIAFQTNILALNAAVEAARAGEQGRGFAVVAGEVRNLAHRSASAAKEIKQLISDSVARVEEGSKLVGDAGLTMDEVVASVARVSAIIGEIAVASGEQQDGIEQISIAINEMDSVTQQNAALVEESAAAADALQQQAASLAEAVSVFKLRGQRDGAGGASALPPSAPTSRALRLVRR